MTESSPKTCEDYLDRLDAWLAGELDAPLGQAMRAHCDSCAACRLETRLARETDAIVRALPEPECPPLTLPAGRPRSAGSGPGSLLRRLLQAWRQPLVFVPALLLLLAVLLLPRFTQRAVVPTLVIDGREYSQAEILRAAEDLETALRYLDKYGSYPARVLRAELDQSHMPLPETGGDDQSPSI